jgi:hypothetical protein
LGNQCKVLIFNESVFLDAFLEPSREVTTDFEEGMQVRRLADVGRHATDGAAIDRDELSFAGSGRNEGKTGHDRLLLLRIMNPATLTNQDGGSTVVGWSDRA